MCQSSLAIAIMESFLWLWTNSCILTPLMPQKEINKNKPDTFWPLLIYNISYKLGSDAQISKEINKLTTFSCVFHATRRNASFSVWTNLTFEKGKVESSFIREHQIKTLFVFWRTSKRVMHTWRPILCVGSRKINLIFYQYTTYIKTNNVIVYGQR